MLRMLRSCRDVPCPWEFPHGFRPGSGAGLFQAPLRVVRATGTGRSRVHSPLKQMPCAATALHLLVWCFAIVMAAADSSGGQQSIWTKGEGAGRPIAAPTPPSPRPERKGTNAASDIHMLPPSLQGVDRFGFLAKKTPSGCGTAGPSVFIVPIAALDALRTHYLLLSIAVGFVAVSSVISLGYPYGGRGLPRAYTPAPAWSPLMAARGSAACRSTSRTWSGGSPRLTTRSPCRSE